MPSSIAKREVRITSWEALLKHLKHPEKVKKKSQKVIRIPITEVESDLTLPSYGTMVQRSKKELLLNALNYPM